MNFQRAFLMSTPNPGVSDPSALLQSLRPIHPPDNEGLQVTNFQWPLSNALRILQPEKECVQMSQFPQNPCIKTNGTTKELPSPPEPVWEWTPEVLSLEKSPRNRREIFGLRKRTFWTILGAVFLLIIITVFAGVIGSLCGKLSAQHDSNSPSPKDLLAIVSSASSTSSKAHWQTTIFPSTSALTPALMEAPTTTQTSQNTSSESLAPQEVPTATTIQIHVSIVSTSSRHLSASRSSESAVAGS